MLRTQKQSARAVTRQTMRFVAVKSRDQQGVLMLHKTRELLVLQRTALINALRAQLAEYGMVTVTGPGGVKVLTKLLHEEQNELHANARTALFSVVTQVGALERQIDHLEEEILA